MLCYDFHDGENCCKRASQAPPGFELVSGPVLELWSQRILENWNLYKSLRDQKKPAPQKGREAPKPSPQALEQARREVAQVYENSTSWKVTAPLRAVARLWKREPRSPA